MGENDINKQISVSFYGDNIQTLGTEQGVFVALKPIISNMGLDWKSQRAKVNNSERWGVTTLPLKTAGGTQEMLCMPIRKLNGWLFSVNPEKVLPILKPKLIQYQEECFHVLHSYWYGKNAGQQVHKDVPTNLPDALRAFADQLEKTQKLESKIEADKPRVEFAEQVEESPDTISVTQFSKILRKKGVEIGRNRLFARLRELKIIYMEGGKNLPKQRYVEAGWFEVDEFTTNVTLIESGENKKQLCQKIKITGKGQIKIYELLVKYGRL